jgi:hypothetical protein
MIRRKKNHLKSSFNFQMDLKKKNVSGFLRKKVFFIFLSLFLLFFIFSRGEGKLMDLMKV